MNQQKICNSFVVIGLGNSGLSAALLLKKRKKQVFCWDDDCLKRNIATKKKLTIKQPSKFLFNNVDKLVFSPGINHRDKKFSDLIKNNEEKIISDLELIEIFNLENYRIGITGTNGKSTTTKFIEKSLNYMKINAISCGNIGTPISEVISRSNKSDYLVVEASSFQLDKIQKLKFNISILLNLSKDHIEWHGNFSNYKDAKLKIFNNQNENNYSVISIDDDTCKKISNCFKKSYKSQIIRISIKRKISNGIYLKRGKQKIEIINKISNENFFVDKKKIRFPLVDHNLQNFLSTYAISFILKKSSSQFISSLKNIESLEHRLELIKKYKNLTIYNDSKSTNIESAKNAITSFQNIYWILGGRKKQGGLKGIENSLSNILHAFCFGESGQEFDNFLSNKKIISSFYENLESCLDNAIKRALDEKKTVNIVFSPACASFDQFKNFEERGKAFKKLTNKLIKKCFR